MKNNKLNFHRIKSHKFCGKKYLLDWSRPGLQKDTSGKIGRPIGLCDSPDTKNRTIQISPELKEREFLRVCIDESIHGSCWALDNDFVGLMSDSIGDFLWRVGFRLPRV